MLMMEFLEGSGEAQGAYSWQHLLFVTVILLIMSAIAVILGRHYKHKDYTIKNRVLIWTAILIDTLEIVKIVISCVLAGSLEPITMLLPLFLCSIQLIAIPVAAFSKGKLKQAALDFVLIFGILGALVGNYGAAQNFNAYPVLSYPNIHSAINHAMSGFASLYILFSGMASMRKENIPVCLTILTSFCILAYIVNLIVDYNYMFLMAGDGTPYDILYNLVGGNQLLYPLGVVGLFFIYIFIFYGVYFAIQNRHRQVVLKEVTQSDTDEVEDALTDEESI